jgi:gluconate 2-dehydrogenase gamma chain
MKSTGGRADGRTGGISRREAVSAMGLAALTAAFTWTPAEAEKVSKLVRETITPYAPTFFTPHEWETIRLLVDIVIPRDERSGSATDAGVPEFMDFMMGDRPDGQIPMRGGLAWLDNECYERFTKTFVQATEAERAAVLTDVAWPKKAKPEMSQGVAFFNMFRDMTASGFWSSKIGIADLDYRGNEFVREWTGCPEPALRKLGVQYED